MIDELEEEMENLCIFLWIEINLEGLSLLKFWIWSFGLLKMVVFVVLNDVVMFCRILDKRKILKKNKSRIKFRKFIRDF